MSTQATEVLEQESRSQARAIRLLLTVSEHGDRQYGVRFAANFFPLIRGWSFPCCTCCPACIRSA